MANCIDSQIKSYSGARKSLMAVLSLDGLVTTLDGLVTAMEGLVTVLEEIGAI